MQAVKGNKDRRKLYRHEFIKRIESVIQPGYFPPKVLPQLPSELLSEQCALLLDVILEAVDGLLKLLLTHSSNWLISTILRADSPSRRVLAENRVARGRWRLRRRLGGSCDKLRDGRSTRECNSLVAAGTIDFSPAVAAVDMVKRTVMALVGVERTTGGRVWSIMRLGRRLLIACTACSLLGAMLGGRQTRQRVTATSPTSSRRAQDMRVLCCTRPVQSIRGT